MRYLIIKKYSESFKDVNVGDSLYFLVFDYGDSKNEKAFSTFYELTNLFNSIDSSNEYDVPDFAITEFKVKEKKYPGHSVRHYNYMKMCGDRPNGVAAKNMNRKYIGFEIELKYFNIAIDRLKEEK